jgi:alpha,alpha-trehalase
MYGWDSFFITLGLLNDGYTDLAKSMVDNFTYEIDHYGRILNANRTYYLTRSQPPFFTSMASAVFDKLPQDSTSRAWLAGVLDAAIREYRNVWMGKDHLTATGLSSYFDGGSGPPPEVELGRFDRVFAHYAKIAGVDPARFQREYTAGARKVPELDKFFRDDRSMRESGHDASYRLQYDCAELVTVDLNALLYKTESDIAGMLSRVFGGKIRLRDGSVEKSDDWSRAAVKRKALMNEYLWDENEGMYFDFNFKKHIRTTFVSATTFYPLWANVASKEQAEKLIQHALPLLRMPGGLAGSTEQSRGAVTTDHPQTQWDYPFGWAPHQILLWRGLKNYGYDQEAREMAYRWLYTITLNAANYNGTITEKYDVVGRSSQVFAEYGNVGTKFSYVTREGFGWTDASYTIGLTYLSQKEIDDLSRLIPPEWE